MLTEAFENRITEIVHGSALCKMIHFVPVHYSTNPCHYSTNTCKIVILLIQSVAIDLYNFLLTDATFLKEGTVRKSAI